jgi:uncharacterized protein YqjF (DUF2071 family)
MRVESDGHRVRYRSRRRQGPPASSDVELRIGAPIAGQSDLEIFLTARFRLYAERVGRIWKADIAHPPWPLQKASVVTMEDTLVCAAGLPAPRGEALAHYAKRVDVQVGPPLPL